MTRLYTYYIIALLAFASLLGAGRAEASESLATGRWARISVEQSGLHVLSASELASLGFTDINRVRVLGLGGALLPEQIVLARGKGLLEVPTLLEGGNLYFYGQGTTSWTYSPADDFYHHTTNHYTRRGYYLLTEGDAPLRMQTIKATSPTSPASDADTYIAPVLHEQDLYSLSGSGRRLYGESFQTTARRTFTHSVRGARSAKASLAAMAYPRSVDVTFVLSIASEPNATTSMTMQAMRYLAGSGSYHIYGLHRDHTGQSYVALPGDQFEVALDFSSSGVVAHLDYYELNVLATLAYPGSGQLSFSRPATSTTATSIDYTMTGAGDIRLFRTGSSTSTAMVDISSALSGGTLSMSVPAWEENGQPSRYLALRLVDALRPAIVGAVSPTAIRVQETAPDLFIITTEALRAESERFAAHYRGLGSSVLVVSQQQIFDEFNGGTPDATAYRLAIRHLGDLYRQTHGKEDIAMQVLLIGDAAYDNRKLTAPWQVGALGTTEFLLSYQSVNSLDLSSYTTDDYFGVISDEFAYSGSGATALYPQLHQLAMDVGIGRLPVRTTAEAATVINKIIRYETTPDYGDWRMRAAFIADNGDSNSHTRQSIDISRQLETDHPEIRLDKIYMSAFPRESVNGQITVPGAKKAILEALDRGLMLINYNGHGNPKSWADEQILTQSDIQNFNFAHLPLWITATCDFAPFDALATSSGEEVLLHPTSGGVALLSTTRVVYDLPNVLLNKAILQELFTPGADGDYRPLGLIVRDAKNSLRLKSSPENRLNFVLLGSPLTRIVMPPSLAGVATIAGSEATQGSVVELSALERVSITGAISTEDGAVDGDFSGTVNVTIYDGEQSMQTIDNFNRAGTTVSPVTFSNYINVIYTGSAEVKEGRYALDFVVPRDVAYSGRRGLISLYALDAVRGIDVVGVNKNLLIKTGGSGELSADTEGPEIQALLLGGQSVSTTPRIASRAELYALLHDESAINLSGAGLGHRITLVLDGRTDMTYDLSAYYTPSTETAGLGSVSFAMPELSAGTHSARFTVWDVYNNASTLDFSFTVQPGLAPSISRAEVSPTPSSSSATLRLWHDQAGITLTATAWIYDLSGRIIASLPATRVQTSGTAPVALDLSAIATTLPAGSYIVRASLGAHDGAAAYASARWQIQQ